MFAVSLSVFRSFAVAKVKARTTDGGFLCAFALPPRVLGEVWVTHRPPPPIQYTGPRGPSPLLANTWVSAIHYEMMNFSWTFLTLLPGGPVFIPLLLGETVLLSYLCWRQLFSLDCILSGHSETSALHGFTETYNFFKWSRFLVVRLGATVLPALFMLSESWSPLGF